MWKQYLVCTFDHPPMEDNNSPCHIHILDLAQIQCNWLHLHHRSTYNLLPLRNLHTFLEQSKVTIESTVILITMSKRIWSGHYITFHGRTTGVYGQVSIYFNRQSDRGSIRVSASVFQLTDEPREYMDIYSDAIIFPYSVCI